MSIKLKVLLIYYSIFIYSTYQLSNSPKFVPVPSITIGKIDAITALTENSDGWFYYSFSYVKALPYLPTKQAALSLINFDCLASNQFSFNTTIVDISLLGMRIRTKILGNSYFRLVSLQYIVVCNQNGLPYISNDCYLCFEALVSTSGDREAVFQKIDLLSTQQNRFQIISFISGVKMYNNYELIKSVQINSQIKAMSRFVSQSIKTKGKTQVQWVCVSTFIVDRKYNPLFSVESGVYSYGTATVDYGSSVLNWPNVPAFFQSVDMMYFGISKIQLGVGKQNQRFIFYSQRPTNFVDDAEVMSFGGSISYIFLANHQCNDPLTPYFSYQDWLCYDTCSSTTYVQSSPIKNCYPCHYSCLTCSGNKNNECITCKSTNFRTINSTTCSCNAQYVEIGVQTCKKCSQLIQYCKDCNSPDYCSNCDLGLQFDSFLKKCICPSASFFVNKNKVCLPYPGCLQTDGGSGIICKICDLSNNFDLASNNTCVCQNNYELKNSNCSPKCGDGINFIQNDQVNCDDGNLINFDGCDSNCLTQIQNGYGCVNQQNNISICSPLVDFTMDYLYTERTIYQNSAVIAFKINPVQPVLAQKDFKFILKTNIPNQKIQQVKYEKNQSLLKIKLFYTQTIQNLKTQISVRFDPTKISTPDKNFKINLKGANLQLTYDSNPKIRNSIRIVSIVVSVLILAIFSIFCVLQQKMAGSQLLLCSQIILFALFSSGNNAALSGLSNLKYLAGFNEIKSFEIDVKNYQISSVLAMQSFKQYVLNFNVMILFQIASILLMIPFKLHIKKFQRQKEYLLNYEHKIQERQNSTPHPTPNKVPTISQTRKQIYQAQILFKKYLNRFYYPISLISLLPSMFYFGVQSQATNVNNQFYINPVFSILASLISLILSLGFLVFLYQQSQKKRPVFTFFRKPLLYPFYLIFLYSIVVVVYSTILAFNYAFYFIGAGSLVILVFRIINKPYSQWLSFQSIDSFCKFITTIICLILIFVAKISQSSSQIICFLVLGLLAMSSIFTAIRYLYSLLCKKRKNSSQINLLQANRQNESEKDLQRESQFSQEDQGQSKQSQQNSKRKHNLMELNSQSSSGQNMLHIQKQQAPLQQIKQINLQSSGFDPSLGIDLNSKAQEDEDELTRIKRRLRTDLKQRRGILNKSATNLKNKKKL